SETFEVLDAAIKVADEALDPAATTPLTDASVKELIDQLNAALDQLETTPVESNEAVIELLKSIAIAESLLPALDGQEKNDLETAIDAAKTATVENAVEAKTTLDNAVAVIKAAEAEENAAEAKLDQSIAVAESVMAGLPEGEAKTALQTAIEIAKEVKDPASSEGDFNTAKTDLDAAVSAAQTGTGVTPEQEATISTFAAIAINAEAKSNSYNQSGTAVTELTDVGGNVVGLGAGNVITADVIQGNAGISFYVEANQELSFDYVAKLNGVASGTKINVMLLREESVNGQTIWTSEIIGSGTAGSFLFIPINNLNLHVSDLPAGKYKIIATTSEGLNLLSGLTATMSNFKLKDYNDSSSLTLDSYSQQGNIFDQAGVDVTTSLTQIRVKTESGVNMVDFSGQPTLTIDTDYGVLTVDTSGNYVYKPNASLANIGKSESFDLVYKIDGIDKLISLNIGIQSPNMETDFTEGTIISGFNAQNDVNSIKMALKQANDNISLFNAQLKLNNDLVKSQDLKNDEKVYEFYKVASSATLEFTLSGKDRLFTFYAEENSTVSQKWDLYKDGIKIQSGTIDSTNTSLTNGTLVLENLNEGEYRLVLSNGGTSAGLKNITIISTDLYTYELDSTRNETIEGNILSNDSYNQSFYKLYVSTDSGVTTYQQVTSIMGVNDGFVVNGEYGRLTIWSNGHYKYELYSTNSADVLGNLDTFIYRIESLNGDIREATLDIKISSYQSISDQDSYSDILITGSIGSDIIIGNEFNNIIEGKGGNDLLVYSVLDNASNTGGNGHDIWTDFDYNVSASDGGDAINISELLVGFNKDVSDIKEFVSVSYDEVKKEAVISIDRDGTSGETYQSAKLLTLTNQTQAVTLDELLNNHQIIF
ncbi:type I secretion C-terminal target domain-containing protein, partial [Acinetobacter sp. YH12108]|uniref:type I secretion C-terminal target domain-containing protein n=1 Tax=Acinetobacter sp. YH12108 TaxID=2601095 RepID=UPI0015D0D556